MKQYPLHKHDAIVSIEQIDYLAKNKKSIWNNGWKKPAPAAWFLRMQAAQLLDMIEKGLLYVYRPKVYAFYESLPYKNQVPDECRECFAHTKVLDGQIITCFNKYYCDEWTKYVN